MSFCGRRLDDRYLVDSLISQGGMSEIYLGRHVLLGRKVAIKILNATWSQREDVVTRFVREARAATAVAHPNIVEVLDVGFVDDVQPYIVMEYLKGECLASVLQREGTLDVSALCGLLEPVLNALSMVHDHGIIHRDLKPDNVFLTLNPVTAEATVKILDFGIAKFTNVPQDRRVTISGASIGTPAYMSPEQARGEMGLNHQSDLFTIGILMYEALTGEHPFKGKTIEETLTKIVESPIRPPCEVNPNIPKEVETIVFKAMAKQRNGRYSTATEILAELKKLEAYKNRRKRFECYMARIFDQDRDCRDSTLTHITPEAAMEPGPASRVAIDSPYENANISTIVVWKNEYHTTRRRFALLISAIVGLSAAAGALLTLWLSSTGPRKTPLQEEICNQLTETNRQKVELVASSEGDGTASDRLKK